MCRVYGGLCGLWGFNGRFEGSGTPGLRARAQRSGFPLP